MARDYAQRGNGGRRQAKSKKSSGGVPGWIWLLAGLSFGLAVAAFVYIRRPMDHTLSPQQTAATADARTEPAPAATNERKPKPKALPLPPKEKDRFTFYEILKNQEVVMPPEEAKAKQPPRAAGGGSYVIQVASFRSQEEADKQKASLALLGVESRIESVTIDGKDTFYRVRVGPDRDWARVQTTMSRLEANGIQALLVKLQ